MRLAALAAAAALAVASVPAQASTVYFAVQTGMQGGQTGIDAVSTSTWTFTTGSNNSWSFGGGYFEMKEGPQTVANITLSVYQGANDAAPLVASRTLTNAEFCAAGVVGNCQSFDQIPFVFPAAVAMAPNTTYFVALTSPAGTGGSEQYFIKGDSSTLSFRTSLTGPDAPSDIVTNVTTTVNPNPDPVPEPMSLALLGVGLAGLVAARRRRQPLAA
jgi:hypothetical protein